MRIANPYIYMCRIANPTQRPALRTSPRTDILCESYMVYTLIGEPSNSRVKCKVEKPHGKNNKDVK